MAPTNMSTCHCSTACMPQGRGMQKGDLWQSIAPLSAGLVLQCQGQLLRRLVQMLRLITGKSQHGTAPIHDSKGTIHAPQPNAHTTYIAPFNTSVGWKSKGIIYTDLCLCFEQSRSFATFVHTQTVLLNSSDFRAGET